jgi:hypothetical protein
MPGQETNANMNFILAVLRVKEELAVSRRVGKVYALAAGRKNPA